MMVRRIVPSVVIFIFCPLSACQGLSNSRDSRVESLLPLPMQLCSLQAHAFAKPDAKLLDTRQAVLGNAMPHSVATSNCPIKED
ncbi:hypothetical protein F5Y06DRAFT_81975 [Hypoxylon sp. FL0890]|nr:hypothetical protein F5Y06DRAFT_81975 [Hypoxylon sp. FL0890]